jgi:hypothetical protein
LIYVLKGGAGYCPKCGLYTQADGIPMPEAPKAAQTAKGGKVGRGAKTRQKPNKRKQRPVYNQSGSNQADDNQQGNERESQRITKRA